MLDKSRPVRRRSNRCLTRVRSASLSSLPASSRPPVRLQASGSRVLGSGSRVQGAGCRAQGSGLRVQGAGFRVQGSGCRVQAPPREASRRRHPAGSRPPLRGGIQKSTFQEICALFPRPKVNKSSNGSKNAPRAVVIVRSLGHCLGCWSY